MTDAAAAQAAIGMARPTERRGRGIALRIAGGALFAAMMAASKYAAIHGAHPAEILFYRSLFALPVIVGWVLLNGGFRLVHTRRPAAHAVRSVLGLAVMACTFTAVAMLPLAEATIIGFSAPLFATTLSALLLRERVLLHRWSAVAIGFVGVLIAVGPGTASLPVAGVAIGLLAALGTGMVSVTLRQIGGTESATATVFWFTLACVVATALPLPLVARAHPQAVWLALALVGLTGGVMQIMLTASVRYAPVSALAPFDYLQLVWATTWGFLLFDALPTAAALAGGALIAAGGGYVIWRERRLNRAVMPAAEA